MAIYDKNRNMLILADNELSINNLLTKEEVYQLGFDAGYEDGYEAGMDDCQPDYSKKYLTFEILSSGTINWYLRKDDEVAKTIEYSKNDGNWTEITSSSNTVINVDAGDIVCFRGNNASYGPYNSFSGSTAVFNIYGNIMSLTDGMEYMSAVSFTENSAFQGLFNYTNVVSAENLILPVMELSGSCYYSMFTNCKSLVTAPELPATGLAETCYCFMFAGCSNLVTPPELPATVMADDCYQNMFRECTNLSVAPELPSTSLARGCYGGMFRSTKLTTAPELPATTLANNCYQSMFSACTALTTPPELPATTLEYGCYARMFQGCTNLAEAPALPATTLADTCYQYMFQGCTSLTSAPELPASTLVTSCYNRMFSGCSSLNYVKCLATDLGTGTSLSSWVSGVAATGTFVKHPDAVWESGTWGIPEGWTVMDAEL